VNLIITLRCISWLLGRCGHQFCYKCGAKWISGRVFCTHSRPPYTPSMTCVCVFLCVFFPIIFLVVLGIWG